MQNLASALLYLPNPEVWTVAQNMTELFNILYLSAWEKKNPMGSALQQS